MLASICGAVNENNPQSIVFIRVTLRQARSPPRVRPLKSLWDPPIPKAWIGPNPDRNHQEGTGTMDHAAEDHPKLGDILQKLQLVDGDQVREALDYQSKSGKLFGESLLDLGFIAEDDLSWALSSQLDLPFVAVTPDMIDAELLDRFPDDFLRKNLVLPLVATGNTLSVVLADPTDKPTVARLERMSGQELTIAVGTPSAIKRALDSIPGESAPAETAPRRESRTPPPSMSSPELATLMDRALTQGASSVHLDPDGDDVRVRFRDVFGRISEGGRFDPEALRALVRGLGSWLGGGTAPAPGVQIWDTGPHTDPLPFHAFLFHGENGPSLTLFMTDTAPRQEMPAAYEDDWTRLDALLDRPRGLVLAVAPTAYEREQMLARMLARLDASVRRCCALVAPEVPLPRELIRIAEPGTPESVRAYSRLPGIDVLAGAFDTIEPLSALAEAGGRDRLVVAAFPGNSALGFLARILETGASATLLSESLLAVCAQRTLPGMEDGCRTAGETLFVERPVRHALQDGGRLEDLRRAAAEQGFQEIAHRARDLEALDETARKDLERHRYLEEAA